MPAGKLQITKRRERAFKITGLTWIVERTFASKAITPCPRLEA
jgi:hypothetical protein